MAIAFISVIAKAQDITISGIKLGATKNEVIKILNEKKYQYHFTLNCIFVTEYRNSLSAAINEMMIYLNSDNIVTSINLNSDNLDIKIFNNYDDIVRKLKEKYGEPIESEEKYYSPYSENYREYPLSAMEYVNKHETEWKINDYTYISVGINKSRLYVLYSDYQEKETTTDY